MLSKAQKTAPYFLAIKTPDTNATCRELYSDRAFDQAVTPRKYVTNVKKDAGTVQKEQRNVKKNATVEMSFSDATTDPPLPSSPLFGSAKRKSIEMDLVRVFGKSKAHRTGHGAQFANDGSNHDECESRINCHLDPRSAYGCQKT